jgi:hypothetical protein
VKCFAAPDNANTDKIDIKFDINSGSTEAT